MKDEQIEIAADQLLLEIERALQVAKGMNMLEGRNNLGVFTLEDVLNVTTELYKFYDYSKNPKLEFENVKSEMLQRLFHDYKLNQSQRLYDIWTFKDEDKSDNKTKFKWDDLDIRFISEHYYLTYP